MSPSELDDAMWDPADPGERYRFGNLWSRLNDTTAWLEPVREEDPHEDGPHNEWPALSSRS